MRLSTLLARASIVLIILSVTSTTYLYLYPAFHRCAFPAPTSATAGHVPARAPLRLLALGDPQLEGDTSLPGPDEPLLPCIHDSWQRYRDGDILNWPEEVKNASRSFFTKDLPRLLNIQRKRLDLWGNDYYLAHIYRTVRWWTEPTHVAVLGDLLGSQWIDNDEFHERADRYYDRVFEGATKLPDRSEIEQDLESAVDWNRNLINIAGNHDIGYAGDFDTHRAVRFEERFAPLNWELRFQLDPNDPSRLLSGYQALEEYPPRIHIIMLNSMNLDSPAYNETLQRESRDFLNWCADDARSGRPEDAVVLLTHIPLYKEEGLCVDGPFFNYFPEDQGGGISEQNHLTEESSRSILDGLFMNNFDDPTQGGRAGIIVNGHDHEGCHVLHSLNAMDSVNVTGLNSSTIGEWRTAVVNPETQARSSNRTYAVREVTLRAMMGSYGGNAGLISGWFDQESRRWMFDYQSCMFGVQHIWWAVHILDLVAACIGCLAVLTWLLEQSHVVTRRPVAKAKKNQ
ncbi:hypothetical protein K461DRAFT_154605 [Myriangium duriaei CBS 260.36]|uniref:Calcineurin-like phosphoesterase domain-containing protein n=1 Tax=Myriangium duriaei CBS 260.36 TaxID=1168546 RepID=A0A9P4MLE0_9PEZI|nr:hypothetical protein K461DRAFT_154605 [Myriangium duriaei CBS 260.36]